MHDDISTIDDVTNFSYCAITLTHSVCDAMAQHQSIECLWCWTSTSTTQKKQTKIGKQSSTTIHYIVCTLYCAMIMRLVDDVCQSNEIVVQFYCSAMHVSEVWNGKEGVSCARRQRRRRSYWILKLFLTCRKHKQKQSEFFVFKCQ